MNVEKWDIFNENGVSTGRTVFRGNCVLKPGEYHLVVHIWILSSKGEFLIQRRSDEKKLMPGEWAATGGAAIAGESSFAAAQRELFEELGIASDGETLKKISRIKRRNSLLDIFVTVCDIPEDRLVLQSSEVAEARWVTRGQLENMIKSGKFHNYGKEYFDEIFEKTEELRGALL